MLPLTAQHNYWDSCVIICNCLYNSSFILIFSARWVSLMFKLTEKHNKKFYRFKKGKLFLWTKLTVPVSSCSNVRPLMFWSKVRPWHPLPSFNPILRKVAEVCDGWNFWFSDKKSSEETFQRSAVAFIFKQAFYFQLTRKF